MHSVPQFILACLVLLASCINSAYSQDVEPRRWSSLPLGTKIIGAGYGYTTGEVFFDPLLEVEDASVEANSILVSYVQPFKIGSKSARIDVVVPFSFIRYQGLLNGEVAAVNRSGFGDSRVRFSMNLTGPPALGLRELQQYYADHPTNTTFGVSLSVKLPIGQYFEDKLINIGENRFVIRPQVGLLHNWKSWSYELTGSLNIYTKNNDFFGGNTREQNPLFTVQTHLIKKFPSRIWGSVSMALGFAGESIITQVPKNDNRTNLIGALSVGFPIMKGHNVKVAYLFTDAVEDVGADTNTFVLGWSLMLK